MKYRLGDFTVKNWNSWDNVPRDPVTIGGAIAAYVGAGTVGTAIIIGLTAVGISMATSWAINALTPKADFSSSSSRGLLVNARDPAAPAQFVYGQVRKGGVVTYYESTGAENKYLHQIIVLAGHEVDSIGDIYVNDKIAVFNENTVTTAYDPQDKDNPNKTDNWDSKIYVRKFTGAQGQNFYSSIQGLTNKPSVGPNFRGENVAFIYVRYSYDTDIFANGVPIITAVVNGKKVYDPRSDTTAYSSNAALCIRDFLTAEYGLNESAIDDVAFAAAANECDENINLDTNPVTTEKRYTINGVISSDTPRGAVFQKMMTACAGTLFWGMGAWKLKVGAYSAPVKSFGLDDFRSGINLATRLSMQDNFNAVQGTFNNAAVDWITTDYPSATSAAFLQEDNNQEAILDLELPFTTSAATAQRLAKLTLFRGREQMTLSADFGLSAFEVEVGDIIDITNSRYGWTNKEFEVVGWRLAANQDAGDIRVNLTLRETSEAAFDWNAEEVDIIYNNTNLPIYNTVDAVTNLVLTASTALNDDGITIPSIVAQWDISTNAFVSHYEIQYKRLGGEEDYGSVAVSYDESDDWGSITVTADDAEDYGLTNEEILTPDPEYSAVFGSSNRFVIEPILNGYDYVVRVRAISAIGVRSPWVSASLASQGDTTPPNEPLNVSAVGGKDYITISWTNPADQDFNFVEVWENIVDNLNTATQVGTSASTNFMRPNLSNNVTRYYWVRAVDYSLNKSDFSSSVNATTLLITPNDFNDAVNDLFSEAGAFGIEPVQSLPTSGSFDGQLVLLLPDITIYRWDDATSSWSTDLYTASSVEAGSITYTSFAAGIEPVGVVDALPTVSGYEGPVTVVLTTDGKLYRLVSGAWTAAVNTADIEGTIGENLFSDDLRPVERVATLPTTGLTQGRIVLLTTDNKMYRYTGSAWTSAVPAVDITGQVNGTQIADSAITASKIGSAAITTAKIATDAVTSDIIAASAITSTKISDNAITSAKITAGAIITGKIAAGAVTADEITAGAITTAKIAAGAITSAEIAAEAITAGKIAANAVTATEIAADAITSDKIAANAITATEIAADAITASKIEAGAVQADAIAANAVNADKIAANSITAGKIAASAITSEAIAADAITAGKVAAGAISTAQLQADAVTADILSAGSVYADAIQTDAITADKIAASSIISSKLAAGAVTANSISAGAVTADAIAVGTITGTQLSNGSVSSAKVAADLQSDNYVTGASGWKIERDTGNVEFQDAIIRGTLNADDISAGTISAGRFIGSGITRQAQVAVHYTAFPQNSSSQSVSLTNCTAGSAIVAFYSYYGGTSPTTQQNMTMSLTGDTSRTISQTSSRFSMTGFLADSSSSGGTVTATVSRSGQNLTYPYGFKVVLMEFLK